jgi:hypothetical protein
MKNRSGMGLFIVRGAAVGDAAGEAGEAAVGDVAAGAVGFGDGVGDGWGAQAASAPSTAIAPPPASKAMKRRRGIFTIMAWRQSASICSSEKGLSPFMLHPLVSVSHDNPEH